jgi:hypothetical protein
MPTVKVILEGFSNEFHFGKRSSPSFKGLTFLPAVLGCVVMLL